MEGIHGVADHLALEKLQELLLTLGNLGGFLPESPPTSLPPPHDHDWLLPLSFLIVAVVSLLGLFSYVVLRCVKCKPGADGEALMLDHECAIAVLVLVLFVLFSLGSFYYYYCFRAGCFGGGKAAEAPPARKLLSMMSR